MTFDLLLREYKFNGHKKYLMGELCGRFPNGDIFVYLLHIRSVQHTLCISYMFMCILFQKTNNENIEMKYVNMSDKI